MKLIPATREAYRKERAKSAAIKVILFGVLLFSWPIIWDAAAPSSSETPTLSVTSYNKEVKLTDFGSATVSETATIDFKKKQKYEVSLSEHAATDPAIRFRYSGGTAAVDGKTVPLKKIRSFKGYRFIVDKELKGEHTIELTYYVDNLAFKNSKGEVVVRLRLLPSLWASSVSNFSGSVTAPGIKKVSCWTTEDSRPLSTDDNCEFSKKGDTVAVRLDDPKFLESVRVVLTIEDGNYPEYRLPWGGYWDPMFGLNLRTPLFSLGVVVFIAVGLRRAMMKVEPEKYSLALMLWGAVSLIYGIVYGVSTNFLPSIGLLPLAAMLWAIAPIYLKATEHRKILTQNEAQAYKEAKGGDSSVG